MDDYLSKPFRPDSLRKLMRQHGITSRRRSLFPGPMPVMNKQSEKSGSTQPPELTLGTKRSLKLIQLFLKNIPGQLQTLRTAVTDGNAEQVRAHAHKLKGSCLAIEAPFMAEAAEKLQHLAEAGDLAEADALTTELETRQVSARRELEALAALLAESV